MVALVLICRGIISYSVHITKLSYEEDSTPHESRSTAISSRVFPDSLRTQARWKHSLFGWAYRRLGGSLGVSSGTFY